MVEFKKLKKRKTAILEDQLQDFCNLSRALTKVLINNFLNKS